MSKLSQVRHGAPSLPPRVVLYAPEKFGKSSWGAFAPKPIFLLTSGETGLLSLIETGRVPAETPYFPTCETFADLCESLEDLLRGQHDYRWLFIDTGNGAEDLCAQAVCNESFGGNWGEAGFAGYGRGNELAQNTWKNSVLNLLDRIRDEKQMAVCLIHHAKIKTANNPTGKDYDQWRPECREKLWGQTHKWADIIIRGGWDLTVNKDDKVTSERRCLFTDCTSSSIGGNRYGLPSKITGNGNAQSLWNAFEQALNKAKPPRTHVPSVNETKAKWWAKAVAITTVEGANSFLADAKSADEAKPFLDAMVIALAKRLEPSGIILSHDGFIQNTTQPAATPDPAAGFAPQPISRQQSPQPPSSGYIMQEILPTLNAAAAMGTESLEQAWNCCTADEQRACLKDMPGLKSAALKADHDKAKPAQKPPPKDDSAESYKVLKWRITHIEENASSDNPIRIMEDVAKACHRGSITQAQRDELDALNEPITSF